MKQHGNSLAAEKIEALRRLYLRGVNTHRAADYVRIRTQTAQKYFRQFEAEGLPRERRSKIPIYDGPEWIGKAIP